MLGVFRSVRQAKGFLEEVQKGSTLCPRLLGLETGKGLCFYYSLGKCRGACGEKEKINAYNSRFRKGFEKTRLRAWPFEKPIVLEESR